MRKVAFSLIAGFIFALVLSSCSKHSACAAYSKVDKKIEKPEHKSNG